MACLGIRGHHAAALRNVDDRGALGALTSLDRKFDPASLTPQQQRVARDRLRQLVELWHRRSIPVQNLDLGGPEDVLQVFTRVNLEGEPLANDDVFFAA